MHANSWLGTFFEEVLEPEEEERHEGLRAHSCTEKSDDYCGRGERERERERERIKMEKRDGDTKTDLRCETKKNIGYCGHPACQMESAAEPRRRQQPNWHHAGSSSKAALYRQHYFV